MLEKYAHWTMVAPQMHQQLPEGYYRAIYVDKMDRSVHAKSEYFARHQAELKSRYRSIGVELAPSLPLEDEPEQGWRYFFTFFF